MEKENLPQNQQEGYYETWELDEIAEQQVQHILERLRLHSRNGTQGRSDIPKVEVLTLDAAATHPRMRSRDQLGIVRTSILRKLGATNKSLPQSQSNAISDYLLRYGPQSIRKPFVVFTTSVPNLYLLRRGNELDAESILVALHGAVPEIPPGA